MIKMKNNILLFASIIVMLTSFINMFAMNEFKIFDTTIRIYEGDITKLICIDAIVNAANKYLLDGSGINGAIHKAAGPQLINHCQKNFPAKQGIRCPIGEARITPSFNLGAQGIKHIIHTVGPTGNNPDRKQLLQMSYLSCLSLADAHNLKSIAFPAISTGIYNYPLEEATQVAIGTVIQYLQSNPHTSIKEIYFILWNNSAFQSYIKQFRGGQ